MDKTSKQRQQVLNNQQQNSLSNNQHETIPSTNQQENVQSNNQIKQAKNSVADLNGGLDGFCLYCEMPINYIEEYIDHQASCPNFKASFV